jgi:hypothetical protein
LSGVPTGFDFGIFDFAFKHELILETLFGQSKLRSGVVLDHVPVLVHGRSEVKGRFEARLPAEATDRGLDVDPVEVTVVPHLFEFLSQENRVSNPIQAEVFLFGANL